MTAATARDPRLDFFRGLGMFIILVAHIPWNGWTDWIPARFGFSDAADLFVFCSGVAAARAFAPIFERHGWFLGTARILHRIWQVYWAHIGGFLVVLAIVSGADLHFGGDHYAQGLRLGAFFSDLRSHVAALMTMRFIPEYFDILPMYIAILAMLPIVMALASFNRALAAVAVVAGWLAANSGLLGLTADPATGRQWFFDPFAWQIVFFTGFAFARGWIPAPPRNSRLIAASVALVAFAVPISCQDEFSCYAGFGHAPWLGALHDWLGPAIDKTHMGFLRYAHFLATAYLAYVFVGPAGERLRNPVADIVNRVGQQTLAVFLTGLVGGHVLGVVLDLVGRNVVTTAIVNLLGAAILIAAAMIVSWFKSAPWRKPRASGVLVKNARESIADAAQGQPA